VATATPTPAATTITSPLVGTYRTSFTLDELSKSPLLYDDTELNRDNWGDLTITFGADGRVTFNQSNPSTASSTSGRYTPAGDRGRQVLKGIMGPRQVLALTDGRGPVRPHQLVIAVRATRGADTRSPDPESGALPLGHSPLSRTQDRPGFGPDCSRVR